MHNALSPHNFTSILVKIAVHLIHEIMTNTILDTNLKHLESNTGRTEFVFEIDWSSSELFDSNS
jgi:hypothetical protein